MRVNEVKNTLHKQLERILSTAILEQRKRY